MSADPRTWSDERLRKTRVNLFGFVSGSPITDWPGIRAMLDDIERIIVERGAQGRWYAPEESK